MLRVTLLFQNIYKHLPVNSLELFDEIGVPVRSAQGVERASVNVFNSYSHF